MLNLKAATIDRALRRLGKRVTVTGRGSLIWVEPRRRTVFAGAPATINRMKRSLGADFARADGVYRRVRFERLLMLVRAEPSGEDL